MIIFLHQSHHSYTHNSLIGHAHLGKIQCRSYAWVLRKKKLPKATYIFTDRERMDLWELRVYSALFQHLQTAGVGYRVINNPATMLNRRLLLRTLYTEGINDFNAYSATEKVDPAKFPVFIRREHDHAQPLTDLLHNQLELHEALASLCHEGEPDEGVLIIEYCAEPVHETLFRKLSVYRIGEQNMFYNCVTEHSWLVKHGEINSSTDALYEEEQKMICTNAFADVMTKAFKIANIDYGRADFGLVNGKVQIYEINTNPSTKPPQPHPNPIRERNHVIGWEKYCKALCALDTTDSSGPFASRFRHSGMMRHKKVSKLLRILNNNSLPLSKKPKQLLHVLLSRDPSSPVIRR